MRTSLTQRGFRLIQRLGGEGVVCLSSLTNQNWKLRGLLAVNPAVELPSLLLEEKREKALLEVERTPGLPPIPKGDRLKDASGNCWQVWSMENDAATFTVKFWLIKLVKGVDV